MREAVEKFITAWERKAKGEMFLDALLHKRIKEPLISGILTLIDQGIAEYQRANENVPEPPKLTEALVREMTAKAKAADPSCQVCADTRVLKSPGMADEPCPRCAKPKPERSPEEAAQMAALKAKLEAPPKKAKKGKAA